jgi:nucleotide sugar dehydrogenase
MIVGIIGCGFVGFSLIKTFRSKFSIVAYDISNARIDYLNKHYEFDNVYYTSEHTPLHNCSVFIIAISTNTYNGKSVDLSHLINAIQILKLYVKPFDTIVLESSIYVGGTKQLFSDFLKLNVYVGFSPERISPHSHEDIAKIPKIISGLNLQSLKQIKLIYEQVIDFIVPASSTNAAELCKLYENCFRVINIAYVNEIADISKSFDVDFNEIMNLSQTKPFGFMQFTPGFGIGGLCLPQNPFYLMNGINNPKKTLPILYNSINILNKRPKLKSKQFINFNNILLIGIGYKQNSKCIENSPILALHDELKEIKSNVTIFDTMNKNATITLIKSFDCLIIGYLPENFSSTILEKYKFNNYGQIFTF